MAQHPPLFEEMLAGYPAEKRELARAAYNRFVDGDSTHFFTQLFLLLDVYANFSNRIPLALKTAHEDTLTALKDIHEEMGLLAQTVETKSVELGNATEQTTALCLETQKKCEAAVQRVEKLAKDIGKQVDTKAIVESIRKAVDAGVRAEVVQPFMRRTEELSESVMPTLEKLKYASAEAGRVWPGRIWKMALTCGLVLGLSVALAGTTAAYWKIRRQYDRTLAAEIVSEKYTLAQNRDAFEQLAVANAPVYVVRSSDASTGQPLPGGYCLYIEGAAGADMHNGEGRIFFNSARTEKDLQQLLRDVQDAGR